MNQFWLGFLVGAFISPFVITFVVWAIHELSPVVMGGVFRKAIRRMSNKYHLAHNPKRIKKSKQGLEPRVRFIEGNVDV